MKFGSILREMHLVRHCGAQGSELPRTKERESNENATIAICPDTAQGTARWTKAKERVERREKYEKAGRDVKKE